jgi:hypothetical protein
MGRHRNAAAGLIVGLGLAVPGPAKAGPVIQGSTQVAMTETMNHRCSDECAAFVAAGCPASLVKPDGVTASIVDVSELGGQTLTFSWESAATRLYDEHDAPNQPRMWFYVLSSCVQPEFLRQAFILTTTPADRSEVFTIPHGSRWLVAVGSELTWDNRWSAA